MTKLIHMTNVPKSLVFLQGQPKYMKVHGFDVGVLSAPGDALDEFGVAENVPAYGVEMQRKISPLADAKSIWKLVKTFRQLRPTILHAHTPKGGLLGMVSSFIARVPVRVYHIRGFPYMTASGVTRQLLMWSERVSCLCADRVFCVSPSIRDVAVHDRICPEHKIVVFGGGSGNGVDALRTFNPERFTNNDRRSIRAGMGIDNHNLVIGYVGRLAHDKGIEELAEAWFSLRDDYLATHLVLVGRKDERDPVDGQTLEKLNRDDRVHLVGEVSDPASMYSIMDVTILPSYREGFGNVLIEAASMGLPVIASRIPGCVDAVQDGVTGTLVTVRDSEALRAAIDRYLGDPSLRGKHGAAGRERVLEKFLDRDIWDATRNEYHRLMELKGIASSGPRSDMAETHASLGE